ncbi:MAG: MerR family DNA-binding transcriptional regulator [Gammaproteobacteria bacterium]|nr:MAG: MerR family DNA-binding transcriptional regulator [Gammaproteobacteria bacterium]
MRELSIGEVAREAGMPASTLRYYEKAGLLPAPPRADASRGPLARPRHAEARRSQRPHGPRAADEVAPRDELPVPLPAPGGLREIPAHGQTQTGTVLLRPAGDGFH